MLTYTYVSKGKFALMEKPKPVLQHERDAIVKVTLASICSSDLHIKHGSVPRAVPGITVGHEMVGIVEEVGSAVTNVKPGDRVTVNVETFCGECFFCKKGFVNNCTDQNGGWALGCRIDGGQAEYVRVPFADILHEAVVVTGRNKHKILLQKCYLSMNFSTLLLTVLKLCAITKACSGERGMREPQGSREDSAPDARS